MNLQLRFALVAVVAAVAIANGGWAPAIVPAVLVGVAVLLAANALLIHWSPGPRVELLVRRSLLGVFSVLLVIGLVQRPFVPLEWVSAGILLLGVWWRDLMVLASKP